MVTWAYRTTTTIDDANVHLAVLEAAGLTGMSEEDGRATLWFDARAVGPLPVDGTWEEVADTDWNAVWKASMRPVTVGRITIVPPWLDPPGAADLVIRIEPGMAFGTGHHETTAGCLAALQEVRLAGRRVVDVGTGTGVLAIAAALLGAAAVEAVDVDPVAVELATENARAHGVDLDIHEGSVADVSRPGDVVVANLLTDTLRQLAARLVALVRPGGTLIASGIAVARGDEVAAAFAAAGLAARTRPGRDWAVLLGHRPPARST